MENKEDIIKLITENLEPDRKEEIFSEIGHDPEYEEVYNKVKVAQAFLASTNKMPEYKIENSYKKLQKRMRPEFAPSRFKAALLLKYAAILILILGAVPATFYIKNQFARKAVLKYTSIITENGETSQIVLPDSSVVWLNACTSLTYNNNYSFNNRELLVKGEAYLNVRKNREIPLIINCDELKIKVLGTSFNVKAYPEEHKITVALESGSVELLHAKNESFSYKLKPGEIAQYDTELKNVTIKRTAILNYTGWKEQLLVFKDAPMAEVIRVLERKFDVEITVRDQAVYEPAFNATFRNEDLTEILNYIRYSCHIAYKIQKDKTNKTSIELYR